VSPPFRFAPRCLALGPLPDAGELVARLAAHGGLIALDSAGGAPRRWSLVAFDPLKTDGVPAQLGALRTWAAELAPARGDDLPGPFHGGLLAALSYDLGPAGERVARLGDPWGAPRVLAGRYVDFLVRDETSGQGWLVLGDEPGDGRAPLEQRRERVRAELAGACAAGELAPLGPLVRHTPAREHRRRIEVVRERIAAGDFYQVNLAHRMTRAVRGAPVDLYRRLRAVNPAPYMAYAAWDEANASRPRALERGVLLSASPELLFEFDGQRARTRPIKGTAPRGSTPDEDRARAAALLASAKDRAELAMIVDLERNDLGRVARAGGVRVEGFAQLESYASVHHLCADVLAEIAPGRDAFDLLAALFPGGSISGAPKLASLAAIAELEGEGRGFFTGSLGFVDTRGHAAFNILIRTLVWRPAAAAVEAGGGIGAGEVSFHVGGGITWSSEAAEEDRETLAKGLALARALAGPDEEPYASLTEAPRA